MAVCQNLVPLVNIKIAGKWMFIPLKMVLIGIDPYPCVKCCCFIISLLPMTRCARLQSDGSLLATDWGYLLKPEYMGLANGGSPKSPWVNHG